MELLECKHLYKEFDNKQILKDINLIIPRGRIIGLLGKNGVGKSTFIKLINDLLIPTSGEILINGQKPGIISKETIAYLPERTYLDKSMKISQIITFFTEFYDNFDKELVLKNLEYMKSKGIAMDIYVNHIAMMYDRELEAKVEYLLSLGKELQDIYLNPTVLVKYDLDELNRKIEAIRNMGMNPSEVPLMVY